MWDLPIHDFGRNNIGRPRLEFFGEWLIVEEHVGIMIGMVESVLNLLQALDEFGKFVVASENDECSIRFTCKLCVNHFVSVNIYTK
jgi:hypothetical protein